MIKLPRLSLPSIVVLVASLSYCLLFSYLSILKFGTFNDTFDLGISNHVLWLLSHGGFSTYQASHFSSVYPFQFQKPIIFLVLAIYYLVPGPSTLLVIQSVALGGAALPLYLFSNRFLNDQLGAMVITLSYLSFFPLASANLFDFHFQTLFPILFFSMCYFWSRHSEGCTILFALLTAMVNPLTLLTSIAFLLLTSYLETSGHNPLARIYPAFRSLWSSRLRLATVAGLVATLIAYRLLGTLYIAGLGTTMLNPTIGSILSYSISQKLLLFVYLLAAVGFVPFYRWTWIPLIFPYLGWVFYSTDSATWAPFGLMYPIMAAGPIYFGIVLTLASARTDKQMFPSPPRDPSSSLNSHHLATLRRSLHHPKSMYGRMIGALVVSAILFSLVYSPFSPLNSGISGGYFAGNHETQTISASTPQTRFLSQVISLIPPQGSVLTQNNIPQLSGREYWQPGELYSAAIPYDYILIDTSLNYFSGVTSVIPFVTSALSNGTFGVLAEGQGALLLERGYEGLPQLYVPLGATYDAANLTPGPGSTVNGSSIVDSQQGFTMWYGPFIDLPPGTYQVTFSLETNTTTPSAAISLYLDVSSGSAPQVYAQIPVTLGNFSAIDTPMQFNITFHLSGFTQEMQFRGMFPTGAATMRLLGVIVEQKTPT